MSFEGNVALETDASKKSLKPLGYGTSASSSPWDCLASVFSSPPGSVFSATPRVGEAFFSKDVCSKEEVSFESSSPLRLLKLAVSGVDIIVMGCSTVSKLEFLYPKVVDGALWVGSNTQI